MKVTLSAIVLFSYCLLVFPIVCHANQGNYLHKFIRLRQSDRPPRGDAWPERETSHVYSPVYVNLRDGSMKDDKIDTLPGQPEGVNFDQYSGYVTVDPKAGRELFYYFAESPGNSSTKPLILWLNGGPGCSSLIGAMEELGPYRVNSDSQTLSRNPYAWNNVANVIFLESPAGVGFSYSNKSSDYDNVGDKNTAKDAYIFLVNWLERFPQYKTRDFFLTGESYSGHYVPQLAYTILANNKHTNQTVINLRGLSIGNAWIDDYTNTLGVYDYLWTHALNSDETNKNIHKSCDADILSGDCYFAKKEADSEYGNIDIYNIYAPLCPNSTDDILSSIDSAASVNFDPCTQVYTEFYLNRPEVQKSLHVRRTSWSVCSDPVFYNWNDMPTTILPIIRKLISNNIRVWMYSGDIDGVVPVTSSRYAINTLKFPIKTTWYPWSINKVVGGYAVEYTGMVFATVRGAGHTVPSYQPERALTLISSFLQGKLPPK